MLVHIPNLLSQEEVAHVRGVGAPVHGDVRRSTPGDDVQDLRVREAAGDVVDQHRARVEGGVGHLRAHRVHGDDRAGGGEGVDHRKHTVELLAHQRASRPGPGRLAADVEDVGALLHQVEPVRDGRVGVEPLAAVGEGVRGHVHDAHHEGASAHGEAGQVARGPAPR